MADPFVAEIRIFPFNFAPKGWAWCNGQLLPISQNTALFSLLGTNYGGDGKSTFALPDLEGASPMFYGQGSGLSDHGGPGELGGVATVSLLQSEIPVHTHNLRAAPDSGDNTVPGPAISLAGSQGGNIYVDQNQGPSHQAQLNPQALTLQGGDAPHNNLMPYLTYYFNIALQGVFPPRQ